jgi:putative membrane protein
MLHSMLSDTPTTYNWIFTPSIAIGLVCLSVLYAYLVYADRRDGQWGKDLKARHIAFFAAGILTLYLVLQSPLDQVSDYALFSAHMTQHVLLALIAPACLLFGVPTRWLRALYQIPIIGPLLAIFTNPIVAFIVFNFNLWLWHVPALYEGALRDENIHVIQHLLFIATGTLMWLPILHAVPPNRPMGYLAKIGYLFFGMLSSSILGAIFTFAGDVIFNFYGNIPLNFGLTPLDDQQLAGSIMWVPGGGIFLTSLLFTFAAWLKNEDRKGQQFDQQQKEATQ